jgi:hypothetical protein
VNVCPPKRWLAPHRRSVATALLALVAIAGVSYVGLESSRAAQHTADSQAEGDARADTSPGSGGAGQGTPVAAGQLPLARCPLPKYPTPACTGVPPGTKLTELPLTSDGEYTVTEDGALIDGAHVAGSLVIRARDVTIKNSLIDGSVVNDGDNGDTSFTITDSTVGPESHCVGYPGVLSHSFTAVRVLVRNHDDGFQLAQPGGTAVVRDSFAKVCGLPPDARPPDGSHADPFQAYCPQVACGSVLLEHNTFEVATPYHTGAVFAGDTASNGHPTGFTLKDNLLVGGAYSIYVGWQAGPKYTILDNRVVTDSTGFRKWDYAPASSNGTCGHQMWSGNTIVTIDRDYNITSTVSALNCMG